MSDLKKTPPPKRVIIPVSTKFKHNPTGGQAQQTPNQLCNNFNDVLYKCRHCISAIK